MKTLRVWTQRGRHYVNTIIYFYFYLLDEYLISGLSQWSVHCVFIKKKKKVNIDNKINEANIC